MTRNTLLVLALAAMVAGGFVLSLHQTSQAALQNNAPFPNPVQQRLDTVAELKIIAGLLVEQNKLIKEQTTILKEISGKTVDLQ